jgi:hypothetical protein
VPSDATTDPDSFDAATAVELVGEGVYRGAVHPRYTVGDKPNGGYLLALMARAACHVANEDGAHDWDPVSSSITYLRPPTMGPCEVRTTVLRRGRTASHVRAVLCQEGAELVDSVFVASELPGAGTEARYDAVPPLHVRPPDECIRLVPQLPSGVRVGFMEVLDLRLDPASVPFSEASPRPSGPPKAELRGWTSFADGRPVDAAAMLFFIDAIPPATMMLWPAGWVPTLQMATYLRARPAPGRLGIRMTAQLVSGGMVDETCTLWDSHGTVVAQASQLARLRIPDETS